MAGMYLISSDIEAARAEPVERGVEVSETFHFGPQGETLGLDPRRADYNKFRVVQRPGWQRLADPGSQAACSKTVTARIDTNGVVLLVMEMMSEFAV